MQKDVDKIISATKQLALDYRNFTTVKDCMCKKYDESEDLRKTRDKVRAMFISFYDAYAAYQQSQRDGQIFNVDVVKETVADLQSAHVEFQKL